MNNIRNLNLFAKPTASKLLALTVVLMLIMSLGVAQVQAKTTTITSNYEQPFHTAGYLTCAAGGAGEWVDLTGSEHILLVTTIDDTGVFHSKFHYQSQQVTGIGRTTGIKYQGSILMQGTINGKVGDESTFSSYYRFIGQGTASNWLIHDIFHMTVHPDGTITAYVVNSSMRCDSVSYP